MDRPCKVGERENVLRHAPGRGVSSCCHSIQVSYVAGQGIVGIRLDMIRMKWVLSNRQQPHSQLHHSYNAVSVYDVDWSIPTAVVMGNEMRGVSEEVRLFLQLIWDEFNA